MSLCAADTSDCRASTSALMVEKSALTELSIAAICACAAAMALSAAAVSASSCASWSCWPPMVSEMPEMMPVPVTAARIV